MAVDPSTGTLYILDARGPRIVKVEPAEGGSLAEGKVSATRLRSSMLRNVRGLAFDPAKATLHVRSGRRLVELNLRGAVVATRDLSRIRLRNPQGIVFAPTGDSTDDRARTSLYLTDAGPPGSKGSGQIVEIALDPPETVSRIAFRSAVARTVDMAALSPRSPDPSGITYVQATKTLMIVDGEVDEIVGGVTQFAGANVWETTPAGQVVRTGNTSTRAPGGIAKTQEPTDVAWNPKNGHFYVTDDDKARLFDVDPGADTMLGTADDVWVPFDIGKVGNIDPEGVAYDSMRDRIFVADGLNQEIYEYKPDGTPVRHFDVAAFGIFDPEGIEYNPDRRTLLVLGNSGNPIIVETSTDGALLRTFDYSAADVYKPAGLTYAAASDGSGKPRFYIVDRGVDNNVDPSVVDGKLFELTAPALAGAVSTPPVVDAGPDQTVTLPAAIALGGRVSDDGAPKPPGAVTATWSQVSGPGTVAFGNPRAPAGSATVAIAGVYTLRLTATDGEWTTVDDVTVTVEGAGGIASQDIRVAASADDAEETTTGSISLTSTDIDLMIDSGSTPVSTNRIVGLRFRGVTVPRGAQVTSAYVQFQTDEVNSEPTVLTIRAQADDNAPGFTRAPESISSRQATTAAARWTPAPWRRTREAGLTQRTSDLSKVVQEIVSRSGWASGNAIVLLVTGASGSHRVARSSDTRSPGGLAPLLHIEWRR
jgi:uncharacterized protein YjiK